MKAQHNSNHLKKYLLTHNYQIVLKIMLYEFNLYWPIYVIFTKKTTWKNQLFTTKNRYCSHSNRAIIIGVHVAAVQTSHFVTEHTGVRVLHP